MLIFDIGTLYIYQLLAYDSDDVEELFEPSDDEIKEDQWLGVTVRSQGLGGKVSTCKNFQLLISVQFN